MKDITAWQWIQGIIVLLMIFGAAGWIFWRTLKKSDDPGSLISRWVITVFILGAGGKMSLPLIFQGAEIAVVAGVLIAAACAIVVGLIWAPTWADILFSPITNAFTGGNEEPEQRAIYSSAQAKRGKGRYREAVQDIRKQLEKFPNDFSGLMLLAQIQAEHLNDLAGAQITIEKIINQTAIAPANFAGALHQLADFHLKYGRDREAAEQALQKIINRFPDSQFSQMAAQRIAHLPSTDQLLENGDAREISLGHYEKHLGLKKTAVESEPTEESPAQLASKYLKHLEQHPLDGEVREKLALLYAEKYKRLDLARGEIDTLVSQTGHSTKNVARWLNLLADLQLRIVNDLDGAAQTLIRIEERFPGTAHAEQANTRRAYLKLEAKRHEAQHTLKLGVYEKNLGLKQNRAS